MPEFISSHPQAKLAACSSSCHPVLCRMEFGDSWDGCYTFASQLSKLLSIRRVNIDKSVHITNTEPLNAVLWELLPLGA